MSVLKPVLLSIGVCLISLCAEASDSTTAKSYMASGDFEMAHTEAERLGTAEGYALAAEALLSEIMLGEAEKNKKQAKRARKLAEAGLEIEPSHQNARLQYAIADGFITREAGDVSAWMKKLPQKTHTIVEAYRADYPEDARGDALMGAWHLAIARKAGNKNATKWFGASIADGQALFLSALEDDPQDLIISINYAFALIALDDDDMPDTTEARAVLERSIQMSSDDHLSDVLKGYGTEALSRLDDRDRARDYVGMFLDGETPE